MTASTGSDGGGAPRLRRRLILALVLAAAATIVVVAVLVGAGSGGIVLPGGAAATAGAGSTVPPVAVVGEVVSDGYAAPSSRAELAADMAGTVAAIPVALGDTVAAGAPLVVLDDTDVAAELEQAERTAEAAKARTAQAQALVTQAQEQVAVAQANLDQASAALATARDANAGEDEAVAARDAARATVRVARAGLSAAQDAATAAAADQGAAEAAARAVAARGESLTLRAPFAGTVAALPATVGEVVQPGQVLVRVAEPGAWEFVANELDESGIARVKVGAPATVTLDGVPGVRIAGTVARMGSYGVARQGGIVYEVVVVPTGEVPDGVRWNMTATIAIEAGE
jgi:HlyD family secretion protein